METPTASRRKRASTITPTIRVEAVTGVDDSCVAAFAGLVTQLSSTAKPPTRQELLAVVTAASNTVLVARMAPDGEAHRGDWTLVGTLTLVIILLPTGVRAWVEDVVVDHSVRGMGVGATLLEAGIERARAAGARSVELTSRPSREAANRLYARAGFSRRDTNVYRLELS